MCAVQLGFGRRRRLSELQFHRRPDLSYAPGIYGVNLTLTLAQPRVLTLILTLILTLTLTLTIILTLIIRSDMHIIDTLIHIIMLFVCSVPAYFFYFQKKRSQAKLCLMVVTPLGILSRRNAAQNS
jgi:hypothetical protein